MFFLRKVPRVPQAVRREAFQGGGEAAPLSDDCKDCSTKLLDDSADRCSATAGAERG